MIRLIIGFKANEHTSSNHSNDDLEQCAKILFRVGVSGLRVKGLGV